VLSVDSTFVEPPAVFTVGPFDVLHILATDESEHSMEFGVIAAIRPADSLPDLLHKTLVRGTVLFKPRESVAAQEALFAAEMHICKLNQPRHLLAEPRAAVSPRQLLPKRIQGIHQDPMLVVHRLNTDGLATMRCNACHGAPS
jgi:hypothetical protein